MSRSPRPHPPEFCPLRTFSRSGRLHERLSYIFLFMCIRRELRIREHATPFCASGRRRAVVPSYRTAPPDEPILTVGDAESVPRALRPHYENTPPLVTSHGVIRISEPLLPPLVRRIRTNTLVGHIIYHSRATLEAYDSDWSVDWRTPHVSSIRAGMTDSYLRLGFSRVSFRFHALGNSVRIWRTHNLTRSSWTPQCSATRLTTASGTS